LCLLCFSKLSHNQVNRPRLCEMSSRGSANPRVPAASSASQAFDSLSPFLFTANADYSTGRNARGSSSVVAPFLGYPNTTSSATSPSKTSRNSSHHALGSADAHEASSARAFNFQVRLGPTPQQHLSLSRSFCSDRRLQEFLEKMRQPSAFDIVKTIKQFVSENETKVMTPEEAMHVVGNFLSALADSFRTHELWKVRAPWIPFHINQNELIRQCGRLFQVISVAEDGEEGLLASASFMLTCTRRELLRKTLTTHPKAWRSM
jgi:hypothetical protein